MNLEEVMASIINRLNPFWIIVFIFFTWASIEQLKYETSSKKGAREAMQTYYLGRFSIAVPALMKQKIRSSKLRYADIQEMEWPQSLNPEQARKAEWDRFMAEVKKLPPPDGKDRVIIKVHEFPAVGKWAKGIFYYNDSFDRHGARWSLLMDAGPVGLWLKTDDIVVEKEIEHSKTIPNYENIAKAFQPLDLHNLKGRQPGNRFYLEHGAINLPYAGQEESIARFEGHPLKLTLLIEMETDFTKEIETMSLIKGTRAMLAVALISPGGGISKIRLREREVAGMPGEEAVLRVREGQRKDLVFTWQFNGKDDSGEYPTTRIEMESPDGNLHEKLKIWDAVLDSMKPMFERKKS
ncbi:MAG: hypothetical protein A2075_01825 [Geobacteraceae bacterium GWC2_58_44]|nr:MAG: hypothetical protein A2075_01825 [Geobacteraceae bacterium GWC2_58_44]HBG04890.1 hypothetical protein [Geobacter sp.]